MNKVIWGDALQALKTLPDGIVQTCVTSPPYFGLRDYGVEGQIGLEETPEAFTQKLVEVFREVRRVLKDDGTLFLNLGDSYAGAHRAASYGTSDKALKGFQSHDCLSESLCDECLAALRHSPHTFRERVAKLPPLPFVSNHECMAEPNGHLPTSDLEHRGDHNEAATPRTRPSFRRDRAPVAVSPASKKPVSSLQLQATSRPLGNSSSDQYVNDAKTRGGNQSVNTKVCICGKTLPLSSSVSRISDKAHNACPYPHSTTEYLKPKDLIGIPWRVAFALQADGWYLRQDIIWHKPNPMPESVTDRCTKAHEYIFLLSKSPSYYYDHEAVKEPAATNENRPNGIVRDRIYDYDSKQKQLRVSRALAKGAIARTGGLISGGTTKSTLGISAPTHRNRRSVWTVTTKPYKGAHFATFPPDLIEPCVLAGAPKDGIVLDPFAGSGTTLAVAKSFGRQYIGIELNPDYLDLINKRLSNTPSPLPFLEAAE